MTSAQCSKWRRPSALGFATGLNMQSGKWLGCRILKRQLDSYRSVCEGQPLHVKSRIARPRNH